MEISPMPDFASALGASKSASTLLVLFIPSKDRSDQAIDQAYWVEQALTVLGTLFGGATAFPQSKAYGAMMPEAADCSSTNPWSSSATRASRSWSGRHPPCVISCTAWAAKPARELSVSSLAATTWR